jgi:hypothetical protein
MGALLYAITVAAWIAARKRRGHANRSLVSSPLFR